MLSKIRNSIATKVGLSILALGLGFGAVAGNALADDLESLLKVNSNAFIDNEITLFRFSMDSGSLGFDGYRINDSGVGGCLKIREKINDVPCELWLRSADRKRQVGFGLKIWEQDLYPFFVTLDDKSDFQRIEGMVMGNAFGFDYGLCQVYNPENDDTQAAYLVLRGERTSVGLVNHYDNQWRFDFGGYCNDAGYLVDYKHDPKTNNWYLIIEIAQNVKEDESTGPSGPTKIGVNFGITSFKETDPIMAGISDKPKKGLAARIDVENKFDDYMYSGEVGYNLGNGFGVSAGYKFYEYGADGILVSFIYRNSDLRIEGCHSPDNTSLYVDMSGIFLRENRK